MSRKDNIEKNMEFLIKELQKEWDVSKETKHRVTISVKDARRVRIRVQQQIADMGEMLHNQSDMSFKERRYRFNPHRNYFGGYYLNA